MDWKYDANDLSHLFCHIYVFHFRNGNLQKEIAALKSHLKSTKRRLKVGLEKSILLHNIFTLCLSTSAFHIFSHGDRVITSPELLQSGQVLET